MAPRPASTRAAIAVALTLVLSALPVSARTTTDLSSVRIENFGQIDDGYYRGAQPEAADFRDLAKLGVHMVIDLTKDGRPEEQQQVEQAGMKFVRIPLVTTAAPSEQAVEQFLSLVGDPANQPVYVHCQGGRHRTGVMTAAYRITKDNWSADRAYAEMRKFGFETFIGHPELKKFVYDFYTGYVAAHPDRAVEK